MGVFVLLAAPAGDSRTSQGNVTGEMASECLSYQWAKPHGDGCLLTKGWPNLLRVWVQEQHETATPMSLAAIDAGPSARTV
jgi:hypothetical protein